MARTKEQDAARKKEYRAKKKAEGTPVKRGGKTTTRKKETDPRKMPWNLTRYTRKPKPTPKFITWDIETVADEKTRQKLLDETNKLARRTAKKGEAPILLEWADEEKTMFIVKGTDEKIKPSWDLAGDTVVISVCIDGEASLIISDDLTKFFMENIFIPDYDGYYIYAHNAFNFDLKRLDFGRLMNRHFTAETVSGNGNSLKSITLKRAGCEWILRDSLLLLNNKLEKLGKAFAEQQKQELNFEYESFDINNEKHKEYAKNDSLVLYQIIENADRLFMENMGVSIHDKATLPGLAFQAMKQMINEDEYFEGVSFGLAHACRESYHGGQTLALNTKRHENELSLDANSMYVYIMKVYELPTGKAARRLYLPDDADPERTLCLARVDIPEGVFPFLKTKDAGGKVGNFRGRVVGWYWLFELEFQKEIGGSYEVFECYEWDKSTTAIQRFAKRCEALRMKDYDGAIGMIGKLFGNSGYGKFAQVSPDQQLVLRKEQPENAYVAYDPRRNMNEDSFVWVVPTEKKRPTPDMVHWASYITAHARLHLAKIMKSVGFENVDYCDTDSIFIEARHVAKIDPALLGKVYGQFKEEKDMAVFQASGKKAYEYVSRETMERTIANKGIPRSALKEQVIQRGKEMKGQALYFLSTPSIAATWLNGAEPKIGHRRLVTPDSLTDGSFINDIWVPGECEPMSYFDLVIAPQDRQAPKFPPTERRIRQFNKFMQDS